MTGAWASSDIVDAAFSPDAMAVAKID